MTKVSKWHAKQRASKVKIISKEEKAREQLIQECCERARSRRKNPEERKKAAEAFRASYFHTLRANKSTQYPSLIDNTPNPSATAQKGIMALKVKLNGMDEETRKREEAAILEAEQRNKSVAPAYNKGGYQLISRDSLHTIGRKV